MELVEQPWRHLSDEVLNPSALSAPGWLQPIERKLLWWIGAHYWKGIGDIIDAGAFCGASALAFASGVKESPNLSESLHVDFERRQQIGGSPHGPVVSFDKFVDVDSFERDFIKDSFGAHLEKGDSFLDFYLDAVRPYLDVIRVECGDFLEKRWNGRPIEVLFLDICKTRALNAHACSEFMPHLVPGHSIVIQQDFMGVWLPHINWTMEYLRDYFEIVDLECGPSRVYILKEAIPEALLHDVANITLSLQHRLGLLEKLRNDSLTLNDPGTAMLAEGMQLQELVLEGRLSEHDNMWETFLKSHSISSEATEQSFTDEHWVISGVPNWIPRQIFNMRQTRFKTW